MAISNAAYCHYLLLSIALMRFDNADAKNLRLYYEWDSHSSIESIVKELNQFENVNIGLEDHTIVIK